MKALNLHAVGDLRYEDFATDAVIETRNGLGGLDLLVLNAGYQHDIDGFANLRTDEMRRVFQTNLEGLLFSARAAFRDLKAGASIIVTASIQSFNPSAGLIDYAMTKAPYPWPLTTSPKASASTPSPLARSGRH